MEDQVVLIPLREFLFKGRRYLADGRPITLGGTLADKSIQRLLTKGFAKQPDDLSVTPSTPEQDTRLTDVAARFALVSNLPKYHDEHPVDFLERLLDQAQSQAAEPDEDEPELGNAGAATSAGAPDNATPTDGSATPDTGTQEPNEGLSGDEFALKLRTTLAADDVFGLLWQKGITSEKVLRATSDADLKAVPNLGDTRLAKLREAFPLSS